MDSRGETPLFWAIGNGEVKAAEFLIKNGAEVNATNHFGGGQPIADFGT